MRFHRTGLAVMAMTLVAGAQQDAPSLVHVPQPMTPAKTVRVVLVGDSTVNHSTGWGSAFCDALPGEIECFNLGKNGRSSKSYRDQGWWKRALDLHPQYVLLQFGANDVKGKGPDRETDPATTFAENMKHFIAEAHAANAVPVLVTSMPSRNYDKQGQFQNNLAPYAEAVRRVGEETNTPVLDLNAQASTLLAGMGQGEADAFDYQDPVKPAGSVDRVHLNAHGGQVFGNMVAEEFFRVFPRLSQKYKAR